MRVPFKSFSLILASCLAMPSLAGGLQGDQEAIDRIHTLLAGLGGVELWANTHSLYTMERARHPTYGDGIVATFWRDLEQPAERARLRNATLNIEYAFSKEGGWMVRDGKLRDFEDGEVAQRQQDWHHDIYALLHQLALGQRSLTVQSLPPNGVRILDEKAQKIGDLRLSAGGELYFWQQYGRKPTTYLYGPYKNFGAVSFPDWGASTDGDWSFYFVQILPSSRPFHKNASLAKPKLQWYGGALHPENCESP